MHDSSPWLKTKRVNMTGLVLAWKKTCDVRETNPTDSHESQNMPPVDPKGTLEPETSYKVGLSLTDH
ncbi:hypothetical protein AAC387_Pa05g2396 [Persea americana]